MKNYLPEKIRYFLSFGGMIGMCLFLCSTQGAFDQFPTLDFLKSIYVGMAAVISFLVGYLSSNFAWNKSHGRYSDPGSISPTKGNQTSDKSESSSGDGGGDSDG